VIKEPVRRVGADPVGRRARGGTGFSSGASLTVLAGVLVWLALAVPITIGRTGPVGLLGIPVEALVIVALSVVLPRRAARIGAAVAGVLLALLVVLKGLDIGFLTFFDRTFDVVGDWYYLGPAVGVLADSAGRVVAVLAVIGAAVAIVALLIGVPAALIRVSGALARHRRRSLIGLAVLSVAALVCTLAQARIAPGLPVAAGNTSQAAWTALTQAAGDASDRQQFTAAVATDPYAAAPADRLLAGLRGKDVLLVFVESYGQVALTDPEIASVVRPALHAGQAELQGAGISARSAWLVSPTFGGASWLAHSTVQSGVWVDSQQRYDQLIAAQRLTLTRAFTRAGWRTVTAIPEMTGRWPQGRPFYGFDRLLTGTDLGYRGPRYGYALMPDQFILSAFAARELTPAPRPPVMAEIDLLSSHSPWVTPPAAVPWDRVGDGSIFRGPAGASTASPAPDARVAYARTIAYSMRTLASFAATVDDPNLVILAMGDHQPHTEVSGTDANHQVPIMMITSDRAVLDRTSGWGWTPGLQPASDAPVWRMDAVRDRILSTFGPGAGT